MKFFNTIVRKCTFMLLMLCFMAVHTFSQTETDAIMMNKNQLCVGGVFSTTSWDNYWEGTLKRDNLNIGSIRTNQINLMGNYGLRNKVNLLFNIPYVTTKASAGTLSGLSGLQDISLAVKWKAIEKSINASKLAVFVGAGISTPLSDYVADFQPLSIGMGSTNLNGRLTVDYLYKRFFATLSSAYVRRSNIEIDRTTYFTDKQIQSNQVAMPDMALFNFGTGYRFGRTIAEVSLANMTSLGGFDMRRNDMPFPSNRMNATLVGANVKYNLKAVPSLVVIAGGSYTIAGRNMGKSMNFNGGLFYVLNFKSKN